MNIVLGGGGRVGFHLARLLSIEGHEVTIIETDVNRTEQADYALDVRTVRGNAASVLLLREVGAAAADVFIAVTGSDEVNLVAAATAKGLGAKQVVARVDSQTYIQSNILYETILNIDYLLSPQALTALEIARFIETPGMVAAEDFGRGLVQMRQVRVERVAPEGARIRDLCPPGSDVLLGVISRNGGSMVPNGETEVQRGDVVTLIGRPTGINQIQKQLRGTENEINSVVIMGAGSIGLHLAHLLDNRQRGVKLMDWDMARCEYVATQLQRVQVINRDATSRSAMEQERIDEADLFVSTSGDDEHNIMASVLAKEMGCPHTLAVVHQPDFAPFVRKLGIDHAVTPRAALANRVLKLVHQREVSTLAVLEEGQVEILEFHVDKETAITGKKLFEIKNRFPQGALVATILRGEEVIVPGGGDQVRVGDNVIMITALDSIDAVQKMFS